MDSILAFEAHFCDISIYVQMLTSGFSLYPLEDCPLKNTKCVTDHFLSMWVVKEKSVLEEGRTVR